VSPPGPRSRRLGDRLRDVESPAFEARREARAGVSGTPHAPIVYATAAGSNVIDVDGNRYVDLVAGFGALPLGHRPASVQAALRAQERKLWLALGDVYASDVKVELCARLARLFPEPGARVLLGLSGADAVTAALKSAVLATRRPGVVAFTGGYHGLSYGPLAACGLHESYRAPFEGQLGHFVSFAPYPRVPADLNRTLDVVRRMLQSGRCGAVLVEPILGRGGCVVPPHGFLRALRAACDAAHALLVVDEIWTGLGRAGAWLASAEDGVVPDLVCLGKSLGGGLPISACIGRGKVLEAWGARGGSALHTATHFGAPLACAAAIATLDALTKGRAAARARTVGERFRKRLAKRLAGLGVREIRGRGLMVGIELEGGASRALAVARGLLTSGYLVVTGGIAGDTLTLSPPLTIAEPLLARFGEALRDVLRRHP
jgi:4-aminobutyrate aminotransferase-like enzyme